MNEGKPYLKLVVFHRVPSLNRLFAMNPWERREEKVRTQNAFMSSLQASGEGSAILTTFVRNISSTASDTPDSSETTPAKT